MCGICGVVYSDPKQPVSKDMLLRMRESLRHRGPDDEGVYISGGVGLGHRRLSIIDLSRLGRQPMSTPDGRYHLVYNGEIFNYKELRTDLEAQGVKFVSQTDSEVLLWLYAKHGAPMLSKLNGMFAFAIWDEKEKELFAARDRFGIKPFSYAVTPAGFYFASEEKAIFESDVKPEFDQSRWAELLCFRSVSGGNTPFNGVQRLLPGHFLLYRGGHLQINRWWSLTEASDRFRGRPAAYLKKLYLETFEDAVRLTNIGDVPVGVLLSGGLDSGSIAATLARALMNPVRGFTIRFPDRHYDEGPQAAEVASKWDIVHHEVRVDPEDLLTLLKNASWINDEPLSQGDDVFIYNIARYAKPHATVLLSGEGADETLGGYIRYRPLLYGKLLNFMRPWFPALVQMLPGHGRYHKLGSFLKLGNNDQFMYFNSSNLLPFELESMGFRLPFHFAYRDGVFIEARHYSNETVRQQMYIDQHTFLTDLLHRNDRMTMAASVECRIPFLDYRLASIAAALPTEDLFNLYHGKKIYATA
jgi:asparagine synthase (glutamine-hydrolysing)